LLTEAIKRAPLIETILLCLVLALAFYMASWPRLDYPFPLHVDEWMHLGHTTQLLNTGQVNYPNPFHGGQWEVGGHPETGYYLWFGTLLLSTGSDWLVLSRIMPALVLGIIAFVAYAWGRKWGFGLEAAFFVTFIHTTIRFLGPAFLVPVTLGLVFFPVCLILLDKLEQDWRPLPLIVLSLASLFLIHGTTAVALGFVLVVYLVFYLTLSKSPRRQLLPALSCLLLIPVSALVIYLWNRSFVMREIENIINVEHIPLPAIPIPLPQLGYMMLAVVVLGFGFLIARGGWRNYALIIFTAILLFFVQFYRRWFQIGPDILYERGWLYVMLLIALIAGFGLSQLRHSGLELFKRWRWGTPLVYVALALVVAFSLVQRMDGYAKEDYYHVIDIPTYHDFVWIGEELPEGSVALLNPYVGWSFVPISGKYVYTAKAYPWGVEEAREITAFMMAGATDTSWLEERNIDLIYSPFPLKNPDLVEVRDKVYILRKEGG
jgi:hypothetical protein